MQEDIQYRTKDILESRKSLYKYIEGKTLQDYLTEALNGYDGMRILDVGCGYGDRLIDINNRFNNIKAVGIDPSAGMIEQAKQKDDSIEFLVNDLLSYQTVKKFDRIIMIHALHLVDDQDAAVEKILSLLKVNGWAAIIVHSNQNQPKFRSWIEEFSKQKNLTYSAKRRKVIFETMENICKDINCTKQLIEQPIHLNNPKPYLDNIKTTRDRWSPPPTDEQWNQFLTKIKKTINDEIKTQGFFKELSVNGLITIKKQG